MMQSQIDFALATPEILLLVFGLAILLVDAVSNHPERKPTFLLTMLALGVLTVVSALQWKNGVTGSTFNGLYVTDELSHLLKIASYIAVAVTLVYGRVYAQLRDMMRGGELYVLTLFALLGQMVMISSGNLISIYLGLELMSLALYALIALRRDNVVATEAAMKYFVLGALASGFLLYGMSMVYGATGHLDLAEVSKVIAAGKAEKLALVFGIVFLVSGLAFKLGAVPFHMWVPDVYQGSPTAVTLILGGAPKLAAFAITLRLLVDGLHGLAADWQPMLMILAVLSLAIGNLTAIAQTNFKRMLAYSTISHMGFVLLGLMSGSVAGKPELASAAYGASLFYMLTYVLTTLASFGIVLLLSRQGFECEHIDDLKGLNRRSPWHAAIVLLLMFSLAGIPPLVGFYAKLAVLQALVSAGHVTLAVIAVLFSLIGAFYYLRVVKVVYFDEPAADAAPMSATCGQRGVLSVNGLLILVLGLLPGGLMALCVQAIRSSLSL
ncbi:NADH-quinone oxidoreductase subunit NuoN [Achromobacter xylosoxidans]|jgi:NADH-quinone oxidoreductase subunit N|uniref:NADH-quinone oxidoreductase subunit N n=1 Tax=Alcaligenes xylosoxydans xylosoxydans TaxID=85698 RepID=A0A0D6GHE4_ALCXX|nr:MULTISPECIES: NADH-quinone oxidoreductase subunit NuoN [Achromobacter]AHC45852.1 NADH-ubiquinone oxidoreductase chain N [Achromobacter xylosoxidans NBRC 15126 = ATCC 27061]AMH06252.1 NADH-quinone oxidoreductase subunit NuoN [Achromobacter xylosoxidans]AXA76142.1 NADH-quinone oxidoreductase subunit NuoN [Achromobacter xylosoxidans]EFV82601.1 NADH-ubiquinone oxidoreductase [Achromobacter xylosoxidans C54]KAA5921573.1 NADH-quinone oxidoreductase subunit NuoN [Achromobacter xylosoxidans]